MTPIVRHRLVTTAQDNKAFAELKKWGGYARADKPVLFIYVAPRTSRSNSEFYKMRLWCGDREVEPILPAKVARFETATIEGIYAYSPKAISSDCGAVKLEIVSAGNPPKTRIKNLDRKMIALVDDEFSPYYQKYGSPPLALMEPQTGNTQSKAKPGETFQVVGHDEVSAVRKDSSVGPKFDMVLVIDCVDFPQSKKHYSNEYLHASVACNSGQFDLTLKKGVPPLKR